MKKIAILLLITLCMPTWAQTTLRVTRGHVHEIFTATPDEMVVRNTAVGHTLTISGVTYLTDQITRIVVSNDDAIADNTVDVVYNTDGTADVTIAGNIAPYLQTTIVGQNVTINTDTTYKEVITYNLSGTATAGAFNMDGKNNTQLNITDLSITSPDSAAINIRNGKHCLIHVSGTNNFADGVTGGQKGAFFCNGHATFVGDGTINITGRSRHGYRSDEYTIFSEEFTGHFNVLSSVGDAIHVQQYLQIANGTFTITNNTGDGIDVSIHNDSTKAQNGNLMISGGTFYVNATQVDTKAIKADSVITITGGEFNINVTGDGAKGIRAGTDFRTNGGIFNITLSGGVYNYINEEGVADDSNCQGIRSKRDFYLAGDETNHPTFNIVNNSTDPLCYGIRVKGWLYYVATALKASGFNTKDAKWRSGQAKKLDSITF